MDFDFILVQAPAFLTAAWLTIKLNYFFFDNRLVLHFNELF